MDLNSYISDKKHKTISEGEGSYGISIKIFDLPDPILQLILSSLPTKEAIRTSVLSKRWVHLWRGISKIWLREEVSYVKTVDRQQFMNFVRRLLEVFDCTNLKKFSLVMNVGKDASEVNGWLRSFINPKLQELILCLDDIYEESEEPLTFPDHLFTCSTLTTFGLRMQNFKLPSSICFESLGTLYLAYVTFPDSSSTEQLIAGCPSLKKLSLIECKWRNVQTVCISSPVLQVLKITETVEYDVIKSDEDEYEDEDEDDDDDDIGGQNASNCYDVVISGTNLKSFTYTGACAHEYSFHSSTSVIKASIHVQNRYYNLMDNCDWEPEAGYFAIDLLKHLQNVEKLSISFVSLMGLSRASYWDLPLFSNLTELHVVSTTISLSCEGLLAIIKNSPCLQVVKFKAGVCLIKCDYMYVADPLPVLSRTHVKRIEIHRFPGYENGEELDAIKTLLQAAPALDTLYIGCSFDCKSPTGSQRLKKLDEKIKSFPKRSINCEIVLDEVQMEGMEWQ